MVQPMRAALQGWTIWCLGRLARTPVTGDELALVIDIDGVSVSPFEGVLGQRRGRKVPAALFFYWVNTSPYGIAILPRPDPRRITESDRMGMSSPLRSVYRRPLEPRRMPNGH
jgi:hypothetical protein